MRVCFTVWREGKSSSLTRRGRTLLFSGFCPCSSRFHPATEVETKNAGTVRLSGFPLLRRNFFCTPCIYPRPLRGPDLQMPGDQRLGIATFEHRQEVWPASEMRLSDKIQSPDDGDSSKNAQLLLSHNFLKSGRYSFVACAWILQNNLTVAPCSTLRQIAS